METVGVNGNTELRKLPATYLYRLAELLECNNAWKDLMHRIPCERIPGCNKYTVEHMRLVESESEKSRRLCSVILLDEWGTSGRQRPTVARLLELLVTAQLFRVADFIAVEILKGTPPGRPTDGPASWIDTSTDVIEKLVPVPELTPSDVNLQPDAQIVGLEDVSAPPAFQSNMGPGLNTLIEAVNGMCVSVQAQETILCDETTRTEIVVPSVGDTSITEGAVAANFSLKTQLPHILYTELEHITDGFSEAPLKLGGRKLGFGAFGSVYLGITSTGQKVAVKRLHKDAVNTERQVREDVINAEKQFQNEVEVLSKFRHENLLPLLGYSCDGPSCCLVYAFMTNGSLQERLACQDGSPPLSWETRIRIAISSARGLVHLHVSDTHPLVHRDVKSANILLDNNYIAKLGDFGLVRTGASGLNTKSIALTSTVFGTSAYMAPEAFRGDVSAKQDTFSFGVVLLELVTALPPYDQRRIGCDLVTHIEEVCENGDISPLVDTKAGSWGGETLPSAKILYDIAQTCWQEKRQRPTMEAVLRTLEAHFPDLK